LSEAVCGSSRVALLGLGLAILGVCACILAVWDADRDAGGEEAVGAASTLTPVRPVGSGVLDVSLPQVASAAPSGLSERKAVGEKGVEIALTSDSQLPPQVYVVVTELSEDAAAREDGLGGLLTRARRARPVELSPEGRVSVSLPSSRARIAVFADDWRQVGRADIDVADTTIDVMLERCGAHVIDMVQSRPTLRLHVPVIVEVLQHEGWSTYAVERLAPGERELSICVDDPGVWDREWRVRVPGLFRHPNSHAVDLGDIGLTQSSWVIDAFGFVVLSPPEGRAPEWYARMEAGGPPLYGGIEGESVRWIVECGVGVTLHALGERSVDVKGPIEWGGVERVSLQQEVGVPRDVWTLRLCYPNNDPVDGEVVRVHESGRAVLERKQTLAIEHETDEFGDVQLDVGGRDGGAVPPLGLSIEVPRLDVRLRWREGEGVALQDGVVLTVPYPRLLISGRVLDEAGAPVASAQVVAASASSVRESNTLDSQARYGATGPDGAFALYSELWEASEVSVWAIDGGVVSRVVTRSLGSDDVELVLVRASDVLEVVAQNREFWELAHVHVAGYHAVPGAGEELSRIWVLEGVERREAPRVSVKLPGFVSRVLSPDARERGGAWCLDLAEDVRFIQASIGSEGGGSPVGAWVRALEAGAEENIWGAKGVRMGRALQVLGEGGYWGPKDVLQGAEKLREDWSNDIEVVAPMFCWRDTGAVLFGAVGHEPQVMSLGSGGFEVHLELKALDETTHTVGGGGGQALEGWELCIELHGSSSVWPYGSVVVGAPASGGDVRIPGCGGEVFGVRRAWVRKVDAAKSVGGVLPQGTAQIVVGVDGAVAGVFVDIEAIETLCLALDGGKEE
jgi:hypothetical protein